MKRTVIASFCLLILFPVLAMGQANYYYVTGNNVNLRANPNKKGQKLESLSKYSVVEVLEKTGDWSKCKYEDGFGEKHVEGYVNNAYLCALNSDPIPKSYLKDNFFCLVSPDGDLNGSLDFDFEPDSNKFTGFYKLWLQSFRDNGGTGTVGFCDFSGEWKDNTLNVYNANQPIIHPTIYDKQAQLLYCMGYLWKVNESAPPKNNFSLFPNIQ